MKLTKKSRTEIEEPYKIEKQQNFRTFHKKKEEKN